MIDAEKSLQEPSKRLIDLSERLMEPSKSLIDAEKWLIDAEKSLSKPEKWLINVCAPFRRASFIFLRATTSRIRIEAVILSGAKKPEVPAGI